MTDIVQIRDKDGKLLDQFPYNLEEFCWGARTGCVGDLCGGCGHCIIMQSEHAKKLGVRLTIDYLPPDHPLVHNEEIDDGAENQTG